MIAVLSAEAVRGGDQRPVIDEFLHPLPSILDALRPSPEPPEQPDAVRGATSHRGPATRGRSVVASSPGPRSAGGGGSGRRPGRGRGAGLDGSRAGPRDHRGRAEERPRAQPRRALGSACRGPASSSTPRPGCSTTSTAWTCAKGVYAKPVAEHALALTLAGLRNLKTSAGLTRWTGQAGRSLVRRAG